MNYNKKNFLFSNYAYGYSVEAIETKKDSFGFSEEEQWDQIQKFSASVHSPNEIVSPQSWEYKAVKNLVSKGLLTGRVDQPFSLKKPTTRKELAQVISDLLDNYASLVKEGYFIANTPPYLIEEGVNEEEYNKAVKKRTRTPKLKSDELEFSPPQSSDLKYQEEKILSPKEITKESKDIQKQENIFQRSKIKSLPLPKPPEKEIVEKETFDKSMEEIKKKIELSAKDIDTLQKLVNEFKKELKEINKKFKQDLGSVKKLVLTAKGDIKKLEDEALKFKVEGKGEVNYVTMKKAEEYGRVGLVSKLELELKSQPKKTDNLTMYAKTSVYAVHGGRTGYMGYTEGTSTAFGLDNFYISYQEPIRQQAKSFRLRSFDVGNVSVAASPLTVFGRSMQGGNVTFLSKNLTLNMFGGRTSLHPWIGTGKKWYEEIEYIEDKRELFAEGMTFHKIDSPYDSYLYGGSLQFTLFGEQKSLAYLSKVFSFQDRWNFSPSLDAYFENREFYCHSPNDYGKWVNPPLEIPYAEFDKNNPLKWNLVCIPPEVNSVESFWLRYPLTPKKNLFLTLDYAISHYRRPGFVLRYNENINDDDVKIPENKYQKWDIIPDRSGKDQGFIALLDYSKGDIKLFPLGIIRFDNRFVSKNLGFWGLDVNEILGGFGGISFLPISIQSLELYVANLSITKLQDNYSFSTYYITGGEYTPMYMDPSAVAFMTGSSKILNLVEILDIVQGINNRNANLKLSYLMNKFNYYITDNITLKIGYDIADVKLGECIDANEIQIKTDTGYIIDERLGDNRKVCPGDDIDLDLGIKYKTQKYELGWKTSKFADYDLIYEITDMNGKLKFIKAKLDVSAAIADYLKFGRNYKLTNKLKYQLTESTFFEFKLINVFDRFPPWSDKPPRTNGGGYTYDISRDKYFFGTSIQTTF